MDAKSDDFSPGFREPKPPNAGVAGALSPFGCCELKPPKDVPGVDCVCCGVCKLWKPLKEVSPFCLPKLGNDAVVAVLGVTPFCCGWVVWVVWPKPAKDEVLFCVVLVREEATRCRRCAEAVLLRCLAGGVDVVVATKHAPEASTRVVVGAERAPTVLLPAELEGGLWRAVLLCEGVVCWGAGCEVEPYVARRPDCVCGRNEPMLCGPVGAVGVPALLAACATACCSAACRDPVVMFSDVFFNVNVAEEAVGENCVQMWKQVHFGVGRVNVGGGWYEGVEGVQSVREVLLCG